VPAPSIDAAAALIDGTNGARTTDRDPNGWLTVDLANVEGSARDAARNRLLDALIRADVPILGFEVAGGRLQDVFLQLTAETIQ
jgi:hypothetical protein